MFICNLRQVEMYSQAKADILRSSKRQSLESPMVGSLELSPPGLASTQSRLMSLSDFGCFIPSPRLCQRAVKHRQCFERSKSTATSCWRDKGKRFQNVDRSNTYKNGEMVVKGFIVYIFRHQFCQLILQFNQRDIFVMMNIRSYSNFSNFIWVMTSSYPQQSKVLSAIKHMLSPLKLCFVFTIF